MDQCRDYFLYQNENMAALPDSDKGGYTALGHR